MFGQLPRQQLNNKCNLKGRKMIDGRRSEGKRRNKWSYLYIFWFFFYTASIRIQILVVWIRCPLSCLTIRASSFLYVTFSFSLSIDPLSPYKDKRIYSSVLDSHCSFAKNQTSKNLFHWRELLTSFLLSDQPIYDGPLL